MDIYFNQGNSPGGTIFENWLLHALSQFPLFCDMWWQIVVNVTNWCPYMFKKGMRHIFLKEIAWRMHKLYETEILLRWGGPPQRKLVGCYAKGTRHNYLSRGNRARWRMDKFWTWTWTWTWTWILLKQRIRKTANENPPLTLTCRKGIPLADPLPCTSLVLLPISFVLGYVNVTN